MPPSDPPRERPGLPRWVALAATLHAASFLVGWARVRDVAPALSQGRAAAAEALIALDDPPPPARGGAAPGGGGPEPDPAAAERAMLEQIVRPAVTTPAGSTEPDPRVDSDVGTGEELLEETAPDLAVRPRPARRKLLSLPPRVGAASPVAAPSRAAGGRFAGPGAGSNGGPGGSGKGGSGLVNGSFDFGGRQGAFRAEVCFFTPGIQSIAKIDHCERAAVFFTDYFNVSPRRFDRGFPGVADRIEWFAIAFTGEFRVARSAEYRFRLISDDGSLLYLDDRLVIDNDGRHPPRSETRSVFLEAGTHRLFLSYFQGPRETVALQLFVTPPGGGERLFGPSI